MKFDLKKPYCYYFNEMTKIPHGSYQEKAISDWLVAFAKEQHLKYIQDKKNNVIIYSNATKGYEKAKPLMLQAHMDMVNESYKASKHNFAKDPLKLEVKGDWLTAKETTLGADDGAGCAYMLAILADKKLPHPALECVFTVQEEVGMFGAMVIKPKDIRSRRCISLDGGGESRTALSSAGGCRVRVFHQAHWTKNTNPTYILKIRGLTGGHSGGMIHLEKGNSIKLANRIIKEAMVQGMEARIALIDGGSKDNAIPRECDVVFSSKTPFKTIDTLVKASAKAIAKELEDSDAGFKATVEKTKKAPKVMSGTSTKTFVDELYLMPNGFKHRSMAIEGLTITSLNVGIVTTEEKQIVLDISLRSALESGVDNLLGEISCVVKTFKDTMKVDSRYPGWSYSKVSPLRETYKKILKKQTGKDLMVMAGHGGCECGVWDALHKGGMDIISLGPIASGCHTPEEKLNLASFDRTYKILTGIVSACK